MNATYYISLSYMNLIRALQGISYIDNHDNCVYLLDIIDFCLYLYSHRRRLYTHHYLLLIACCAVAGMPRPQIIFLFMSREYFSVYHEPCYLVDNILSLEMVELSTSNNLSNSLLGLERYSIFEIAN